MTVHVDGGMTLDALGPTGRMGDRAYDALRAALVDGRLYPGSRLSVPLLAGQLGVSRSPVREAVMRLVTEGLAVEIPRRGAVVVAMERTQLAPVYEVREVLEGLAARLAATRADSASLDAMRRTMRAHSAAIRERDEAAIIDADVAFHEALRDGGRNHELNSMLGGIQSRVRIARRTTLATAGPRQAWRDHRDIVA
ncbi:MAG: GntR family transcriptional regulator, partial [Mycobacteriales bacterium]